MFNEGTIIALSTPQGAGAIGILRLSGSQALEIVSLHFKAKNGILLTSIASHQTTLGIFHDNGQVIDEVLVTPFIAPRSYTGETVVEISCHGSPFILQRIMELCIQKGAQAAQPGAFTLRAYLNQKMDLSQAEAVSDLIAAESEGAHRLALQQMRGGYSQEIQELRQQLLDFASLIALELDFSEEDVAFADRKELSKLLHTLENKLKKLADSFTQGSVIKKGIPIAIVGKPNAGKSSLLNALLNEERAIVSDIAGTTRDSIEDTLTLEGYSFRFIDTAGLRNTTDSIEAIGVQKALEKMAMAQIILYVYDATDADLNLEKEIENLKGDGQVILIQNKIDLLTSDEEQPPTFKKHLHLALSTKQENTLDRLKKLLVELQQQNFSQSDIIVSNMRHYTAIQNTLEALDAIKTGMAKEIPSDLLSIDLNVALDALGAITGEVNTEDLLGNIFSKFCIGK